MLNSRYNNLPNDIIPSYAGDRAAIGRAIAKTSSGLHREGFLLRPIRRSSSEVTYGIVREQRDESGRTLDHHQEGTVFWADLLREVDLGKVLWTPVTIM